MSESGFERREEGFEAKVHADGEQKFRLEMRRDKLFARWAAGKMGMAGDEVEAYEKDVVKADLQEPGDADVLAKVKLDLDAKGVDVSDEDLHTALEKCFQEAVAEDQ